MNTTAIFAELVIGGLQTLTWLSLIGMTVLGPKTFSPIINAPSVSVVIIVAISYGLGVVFDRIWDFILDKSGLDDHIKAPAKSSTAAREAKTEDEFHTTRQKIFSADPKMAVEFVNYNRSRMRVARSSVFNFALITITGLILLGVYCGIKTKAFIFVGAGGTLLTVACGMAYYDLRKSYYRVLHIVVPAKSDGQIDTV
ncbi:MAG: hypothetical protein ACE5KZ_10825 [Candidatus Scalinduaceae bacterium]